MRSGIQHPARTLLLSSAGGVVARKHRRPARNSSWRRRARRWLDPSSLFLCRSRRGAAASEETITFVRMILPQIDVSSRRAGAHAETVCRRRPGRGVRGACTTARERNSCRAAGAKEASGRAPRCEARERWHSLGHRAEQARELRIEMTQLVGGQAFERVGQHAARRLRCAPISLAQGALGSVWCRPATRRPHRRRPEPKSLGRTARDLISVSVGQRPELGSGYPEGALAAPGQLGRPEDLPELSEHLQCQTVMTPGSLRCEGHRRDAIAGAEGRGAWNDRTAVGAYAAGM
jgi:hypothetical protein